MLSSIISRLVILVFGTLYPAYASYKAVKTKNEKEYVKWMMYWIVFALFTCLETIADIFISFWFPFYYELKILFVLWLMSPATKGSSILYRKFVHPAFIRRERDIDEYINKAKEQGYTAVLQMGSRGFSYATGIVVQTALRGQFSLVNQLRKTRSLSDISTDRNYAQLMPSEPEPRREFSEDDQTETEFKPKKPVTRPKRHLKIVKSKSSPEKFSEEDETTSVDQDDDDDEDYVVHRKIKRPAQRRNTANLPMTSERKKSQDSAEDLSDNVVLSTSKLQRSKSLQGSKKYSTHKEIGAYSTLPRTRQKGTGKKRPALNLKSEC